MTASTFQSTLDARTRERLERRYDRLGVALSAARAASVAFQNQLDELITPHELALMMRDDAANEASPSTVGDVTASLLGFERGSTCRRVEPLISFSAQAPSANSEVTQFMQQQQLGVTAATQTPAAKNVKLQVVRDDGRLFHWSARLIGETLRALDERQNVWLVAPRFAELACELLMRRWLACGVRTGVVCVRARRADVSFCEYWQRWRDCVCLNADVSLDQLEISHVVASDVGSYLNEMQSAALVVVEAPNVEAQRLLANLDSLRAAHGRQMTVLLLSSELGDITAARKLAQVGIFFFFFDCIIGILRSRFLFVCFVCFVSS